MVDLSLRDYLQKVIDSMKLREWARARIFINSIGFEIS